MLPFTSKAESRIAPICALHLLIFKLELSFCFYENQKVTNGCSEAIFRLLKDTSYHQDGKKNTQIIATIQKVLCQRFKFFLTPEKDCVISRFMQCEFRFLSLCLLVILIHRKSISYKSITLNLKIHMLPSVIN